MNKRISEGFWTDEVWEWLEEAGVREEVAKVWVNMRTGHFDIEQTKRRDIYLGYLLLEEAADKYKV